MTDIGTFTEPKNKIIPLLPWELYFSEYNVQKNDSLALIIEILYLKQNFFQTDSCLLASTTSTRNMQSCFKFELGLLKLFIVSFLCLKARVSLVTITYLGKDTSIWLGFQDSYCSNLQLVLCKRLTLSAASVFVTEGLFIYIYFLLFEEIIKIGFPELEKKFL